jgi:hypothetical protein
METRRFTNPRRKKKENTLNHANTAKLNKEKKTKKRQKLFFPNPTDPNHHPPSTFPPKTEKP